MKIFFPLFILLSFCCCANMKSQNIKNHSEIFGRGVYWPWERSGWVAKNMDMDFWTFVENKVKELKEELNCNIIWVVNISIEDASKLCDIAGKYKILVLPTIIPFLHLYYHGISDLEDIEKTAKKTYMILGEKEGLGGYVLVDEPIKLVNKQMEMFRKALKKVDKIRDSIVVTMNRDTQSYIWETNFPVVCADIYPFGADRSPNIPNPYQSSQWYFRSVFSSYIEDANKVGKKVWAMPQAFAENWGPWWYDENMNVVIGKGTYMHWRMPKVEEIRWQMWESLRTGCKGIIFFVYLPAPNDWNGIGEIPSNMKDSAQIAKSNNWPITENEVKTNLPEALLYKNGKPTPHLKEIGKIFKLISRYENLFLSLKSADFPVCFTEFPFKSNTFLLPEEENVRYVIVINDDVEKRVSKKIFLLPNVNEVLDIVKGEELKIRENGNFTEVDIDLEPGDGKILKIEFRDKVGFLVFEEDFSLPTTSVSFIKNVNRKPIEKPFSTGWDWIIEKDQTSKEAGIVKIENISKKRQTPTAGFMITQKFYLYMLIDGYYIENNVNVEMVDNDNSKKISVNPNSNKPFEIPYGTDDVNIYIKNNAQLSKILMWVVPKK